MAESLMTVKQYCEQRGLSRKQFYEHRRTGALKGCFRRKPGGKRQLVIPSAADKALDSNVRVNAGAEATKGRYRGEQQGQPPPEQAPATEEEIKTYLDETVGDLAQLSIFELQRRNELEKLLIQQIKRRRESGELIEAELVEKEGFEFARAVRDQFTAIPDRLAAVLAAEKDQFKVRQLMIKEITHVLEYVSKALKERGEKYES